MKQSIKTIAVHEHRTLQAFSSKEIHKIPYVALQIIQVFLENDFTIRVSHIVTQNLVLCFFLSKRLHHFGEVTFFRVGIISSCMRQSEPQGGSLFTERCICN